MSGDILSQIAALKTLSTPHLKTRWRELFRADPPPYNRRFLESRLAYRIQELAFGGLSFEAQKRLKALALDTQPRPDATNRQAPKRQDRPVAGTRLIREWQGVEHHVTVREADFEYQGRPYQSLSAVARTITGTRWNGLIFFGLKRQRASS